MSSALRCGYERLSAAMSVAAPPGGADPGESAVDLVFVALTCLGFALLVALVAGVAKL